MTHLAEFESRDLHLAAGFPSLFAYGREALRLSEHETCHRILAARLACRFPRILGMLRDGSLSLTNLRLIAPLLREASAAGLLDEAAGRSKRQVQELVARRAPQPDVPSSVRKIPVKAPVEAAPVPPPVVEAPISASGSVPALDLQPPPARPAVVRPLAPERYEMRFTASAETYAKLRRAQDLLRHVVPGGDPAAIVDRALTLLVADLERKKFAATEHPRPRRARSGSQRTPASEVKRAVARRDGDRCAFVSKDGRRCEERGFLEFHHVIPYAMGGESSVENIQLRCRAHNGYEADLYYGKRRQWDGELIRESAAASGRQLGPDRVRARDAGHPTAVG